MDLKKLWPSLIPLIAVLINTFSDQIGVFLTAHPTASLIVATLVTALANFVKSPTAPKV